MPSTQTRIKPESDAAISEIAKLLENDDALKVYIVGHTDNVGSFDSNMKLSMSRAEAVAKALTGKYGIAAARLKPHGVASLSPVASNDTEDGKAKNRRVELVKQ
jgi:outer membrane protein OmpA-like peptidoglycan-associated protein